LFAAYWKRPEFPEMFQRIVGKPSAGHVFMDQRASSFVAADVKRFRSASAEA
jgi:hypothetical protein